VPILKLPVLRGGAVLLQSLGLGIKALNYSANEAFAEAEAAKAAEIQVALTPAVIEGEGDFAGLTGAMPGLFPVPTQKRSKDELKKGATAAAASSIVFALIFNVLLFIAAPLLLTNALFIAAPRSALVFTHVDFSAWLSASGATHGRLQFDRRADSHVVFPDYDCQFFSAEGHSPRL
jgi:hypothetical protein